MNGWTGIKTNFTKLLFQNQEVLKLGEEIEARRREEDERRALMHELHEGRVKELEDKVSLDGPITLSLLNQF